VGQYSNFFKTKTSFGGKLRFLFEHPVHNIHGTHMIDSLNVCLLGSAIRKCYFDERVMEFNENTPEFYAKLKCDISDILNKQKQQEPRMNGKQQALILVKGIPECEQVANGLGDKATFIIAGAKGDRNLEKFTKSPETCNIGVICKRLLEGYDNANVTLCVVLRNMKARATFEQFVGRCSRINRELQSVTRGQCDRTQGILLSYTRYAQKRMWDTMPLLAESGPEDSDDDEYE